MTTKELLFLKDALNLERDIIKKIDIYSKKITDQKLKNICKKSLQKHINNYQDLLNMLK